MKKITAYTSVIILLVLAGLFAAGPERVALDVPCFDAGKTIDRYEFHVADRRGERFCTFRRTNAWERISGAITG